MTEKEEKMLEIFKQEVEKEQSEYEEANEYTKFFYNNHKEILNLIQTLQKEIEEIKEYANWHKEHLTEDIGDYIDDDKIANANIIGEFKEEREHWKDIFRILNNEKTYIDYKNY